MQGGLPPNLDESSVRSISLALGFIAVPPVISNWKAMAPHSSTRAWKTPWMEEPDRLQSMTEAETLILWPLDAKS